MGLQHEISLYCINLGICGYDPKINMITTTQAKERLKT
jgi:hypothetical protein